MFKSPRGTSDILPKDQACWRYVERKAVSLCQSYGYERIDTPVFEDARLFVRGVGEGTDIVEKEMYTFEDRGGETLTLRPEGTAPVCRAYLEHGMHNQPQPVRLYYFAPIYRYERPQSGRYREHHQFGFEALGDEDPALDAEVIEIAWRLFQELGLKGLSLKVNSIGDAVSRPAYHKALREYYASLLKDLCTDCKERYERNPLRLLDCKKPTCQPYLENAPRSIDYLDDASKKHFESLLHYLDVMDIPYVIDHRLVRGLDYYTRTVFEIQPPKEGAQSTLGGGGRYDGLIQELGGKPTPGVGFATGIERIVLNLERQGISTSQSPGLKVVVAYVGEGSKAEAIKFASRLRREGGSTILASGGKSLKAQLRQAGSLEATHTVIVGEDEIKKGTVTLRDMAKGQQESLTLEEALRKLKGATDASS